MVEERTMPAARAIRAIVFDFDGTLVDTSEAILSSLAAALRRNAIGGLPDETVRRMIGRPLREIVAQASPRADAALIDRVVADYRDAFARVHATGSRLLPGVAGTLALLSPRIRLGIATSRTSGGAALILDALGLRAHFSAIVGIEEVRETKPRPEPVLAVLARLGAAGGAAMMVGDTPDDIEAGRAAGLATVGVATGAHDLRALAAAGADYVIPTMESLGRIVADCAGAGGAI
jgi:HAD superfamily hydrolase (TIGR01509 family)